MKIGDLVWISRDAWPTMVMDNLYPCRPLPVPPER
jgi:hypothetical protein